VHGCTGVGALIVNGGSPSYSDMTQLLLIQTCLYTYKIILTTQQVGTPLKLGLLVLLLEWRYGYGSLDLINLFDKYSGSSHEILGTTQEATGLPLIVPSPNPNQTPVQVS
jgi:hypothetical protein